jgi:hypothetical protein
MSLKRLIKKAEHRYFWLTTEVVIEIFSKTTKVGIATNIAKNKVMDIVAKELLKAVKEMAITGALENIDQEYLKNVISAEEEAINKRTGKYTWNLINAISDLLQEMDLNIQFEALTQSVSSGHQSIILAHAEGNFFVNDLDDRFDKYSKSWMKQYINAISISGSAHSASFGGTHITYNNDPTIAWPDRVEPDTSNHMRYRTFYLQYVYEGTLSDEDVFWLIDEIEAMSMPEECNVPLGFYFIDDIADLCYNNESIAVFDMPNRKFHTLEYYLQEELVSDIGTIRSNPSRDHNEFYKEQHSLFQNHSFAVEVWEKSGNIKTCEDKLLRAEHKYDNSIENIDKVYPFDKEGKAYAINDEYVKAVDLNGVDIEEIKKQKILL